MTKGEVIERILDQKRQPPTYAHAFTVCDACARPIRDIPRARIDSPAAVYAHVSRHRNAPTENLWVILLDTQNFPVGRPILVTRGNLNTTRTHPTEVLRPAILAQAHAVIVVHNHPSGNLEPSREDVEYTKILARACELVGLSLYDHLIISPRGFVSLKERGLL